MKNRLAWEYMVTILSGHKYTEYDSDKFVQCVIENIGEIKETRKYSSKNEK